jgi:hypothetical protein
MKIVSISETLFDLRIPMIRRLRFPCGLNPILGRVSRWPVLGEKPQDLDCNFSWDFRANVVVRETESGGRVWSGLMRTLSGDSRDNGVKSAQRAGDFR